jgi:hypothetical protein
MQFLFSNERWLLVEIILYFIMKSQIACVFQI